MFLCAVRLSINYLPEEEYLLILRVLVAVHIDEGILASVPNWAVHAVVVVIRLNIVNQILTHENSINDVFLRIK